jgi:hypothetical protein
MKAKKIKAMADKVVKITMEQAMAMPGILGKVMPCQLRELGYYARGEKLEDGSVLKVFYTLEEM